MLAVEKRFSVPFLATKLHLIPQVQSASPLPLLGEFFHVIFILWEEPHLISALFRTATCPNEIAPLGIVNKTVRYHSDWDLLSPTARKGAWTVIGVLLSSPSCCAVLPAGY